MFKVVGLFVRAILYHGHDMGLILVKIRATEVGGHRGATALVGLLLAVLACTLAVGPSVALAAGPYFADVPPEHHYFTPIQHLAEAGVISGYERADGGHDFLPDSNVLRAQSGRTG